MNVSICLTHHNRYEMIVESFAQVIDDERISEIVISDDASTDGSYEKLVEHFKGNDKVKLFRNLANVGMSLNKKLSIQRASNNTCILFDSDNIISKSYLDAYEKYGIKSDVVINVPSFAEPDFDFRHYEQMILRGDVAKKYVIKDAMFRCLLNCCNYVVNRAEYLKVYEYDPAIKQADTIAFNYLWLKEGNAFHVVKDMKYFHRVHPASGFLQNMDYNMKQAKEFENKILQLS